MTRATIVALALLLSGAAQAADDVCQRSWERAERIRVELGLRPGPKQRPDDPLLRPEACQMLLDIPEADLRDSIRESVAICGGDCRDLIEQGGKQ